MTHVENGKTVFYMYLPNATAGCMAVMVNHSSGSVRLRNVVDLWTQPSHVAIAVIGYADMRQNAEFETQLDLC